MSNRSQYAIYLPTRSIVGEGGAKATFLGLIHSCKGIFDAFRFEFDYQLDAGTREPLVIVELSEEESPPPYALEVSVTLPGEPRGGWQARARNAFATSMPLVNAEEEGDIKRIFIQ